MHSASTNFDYNYQFTKGMKAQHSNTATRWRGSGTTSREPGGKRRRRGPTMGETSKEMMIVSTNNGETCLGWVGTPMACSASTATSAPLQVLYVSDNPREAYPPKRELRATRFTTQQCTYGYNG